MGDSLKIQLRNMPASGWRWNESVPTGTLADVDRGSVDALPDDASDMAWQGSLERKGDCYHLVGEWRVTVRLSCSRCNAMTDVALSGRFMREYRMSERMAAIDDPDEEVLPLPGELDLLDVLREEVWLAWPQHVVCRPDCRGLCPHCGADLNQASCACANERDDHPFAALKKLMDRGS